MSERKSAFADSRFLINLAVVALANVAVLFAYLISPSGRAEPEPPQLGNQTTTQSVGSSIAAENVFCGQVTSIREMPLSTFAPYDVAVVAGRNPIPLSADAPASGAPIQLDRPLPIEPAQATATPTPDGAVVLLDTFNGRTVTFTGSVPRTYMGDGFTNNAIAGTTTYVTLRSYTFYMLATVVANYTDVHARLALWNSYSPGAASVFANSAAYFDVDLGAINVTAAPVFFAVTVTVEPPFPFLAGGPGTQWGFAQNFQGSTTGGAVADDTNLTSTICHGAPYPAGVIATGAAPNYGYYRNVGGQTDFNFSSTDARMLTGLTSQGIGIIIRGDLGTGPTPRPVGTPGPTGTPSPTITPPPTICNLTEGMDIVPSLVIPKGWVMINHSSVPGSTGWFQGSTTRFPSHSGSSDSYVAADYQNDAGPGSDTISNWLLTPPVTLQNGGIFEFWTRTVDTPSFPDRLQVRYSTNGNSSNVGTSATDVGDFSTLVLDINPTLTTAGFPNGYPTMWTRFIVTLTGLGLPVKGRFAFRYFVQNAGPSGINSDYVGIDTVSFTCRPTPGPSPPTPTPAPTISPQPTGTPSPTCQPVITLSSSQTITAGNSASCNNGIGHTDNSYWRAFNMNGFTAGAAYNVTSVSFGIEEASTGNVAAGSPTPAPGGPGTQSVTVRLYTNAGGAFPAGTRTQIATTTVNVLDQTLSVFTAPLVVTVPAGTSELIMEVFTANGETPGNLFFIGTNPATQGGPTYISAADCSINTPTDTAAINFPDMHAIMNVNGACATPTPTPTVTPPLTVNISGRVGNCASPAPTATPPAAPTPAVLPAVPNVLMLLSGSATGTSLTDGSGNYSFNNLALNGTYTVTPSKAALAPGSPSINSIDVVAIQRHYLGIAAIPTGCRLTAADAVISGTINNQDVIAVQRFFLGLTSGTGSTGQYKFVPTSRSYPTVSTDQIGQDYAMYVLGDVASPFANRSNGLPRDQD